MSKLFDLKKLKKEEAKKLKQQELKVLSDAYGKIVENNIKVSYQEKFYNKYHVNLNREYIIDITISGMEEKSEFDLSKYDIIKNLAELYGSRSYYQTLLKDWDDSLDHLNSEDKDLVNLEYIKYFSKKDSDEEILDKKEKRSNDTKNKDSDEVILSVKGRSNNKNNNSDEELLSVKGRSNSKNNDSDEELVFVKSRNNSKNNEKDKSLSKAFKNNEKDKSLSTESKNNEKKKSLSTESKNNEKKKSSKDFNINTSDEELLSIKDKSKSYDNKNNEKFKNKSKNNKINDSDSDLESKKSNYKKGKLKISKNSDSEEDIKNRPRSKSKNSKDFNSDSEDEIKSKGLSRQNSYNSYETSKDHRKSKETSKDGEYKNKSISRQNSYNTDKDPQKLIKINENFTEKYITSYVNFRPDKVTLEFHNKIVYIKSIKVSKTGLFNLLFWLYTDRDFIDRDEYINEKIRKYFKKLKEPYNIIIYFVFQDVDEVINQKPYVSFFNHSTTISLAESILNRNSLNFLEDQNIGNLFTDKMISTFLKFQTLKKFLFDNLSLLDISTVFIIGGIVLYSYGYRRSDDIDGHFTSSYLKIIDPYKLDLIEKILMEEEIKFNFVDMGLMGNDKWWRDRWTETNLKTYNYKGVNNFNDLVTDPKNYYYFQGIKLRILDYEIIGRFQRHSPKDIVDLLVLTICYPDTIGKITKIEDKYLIMPEYPSLDKILIDDKFDINKKKLVDIMYARYNRGDIYKCLDFLYKQRKLRHVARALDDR